MGILPLTKRVNRDKCSFETKQRMFGVFAIDEILRYRGTRFPGSRTLCHPGKHRNVEGVERLKRKKWNGAESRKDADVRMECGRKRWLKQMGNKNFQQREVANIVDVSIISSPPNVRYINMSESSHPHNGILYECADSQAGKMVTPLQPRLP